MWYINNITRLEGYNLDPDADQPLPFNIDEGLLQKGLETIFSVMDRSSFGINIVVVKVPNKTDYRIGYINIVSIDAVWEF